MDASLIRDIGRWTDSFLKSLGIKPLPPKTVSSSSLTTNSMIAGNNLSPAVRNFVRCAGLSGALAVFLGAYGAHTMKDNTPDDLKRLFQSAQTYHLLHSVALLGVPLVSRPVVTGSLFLSGLTLFCGPMYFHAIKNDPRFRCVTPYGGLLLLAGWVSVIVF